MADSNFAYKNLENIQLNYLDKNRKKWLRKLPAMLPAMLMSDEEKELNLYKNAIDRVNSILNNQPIDKYFESQNLTEQKIKKVLKHIYGGEEERYAFFKNLTSGYKLYESNGSQKIFPIIHINKQGLYHIHYARRLANKAVDITASEYLNYMEYHMGGPKWYSPYSCLSIQKSNARNKAREILNKILPDKEMKKYKKTDLVVMKAKQAAHRQAQMARQYAEIVFKKAVARVTGAAAEAAEATGAAESEGEEESEAEAEEMVAAVARREAEASEARSEEWEVKQELKPEVAAGLKFLMVYEVLSAAGELKFADGMSYPPCISRSIPWFNADNKMNNMRNTLILIVENIYKSLMSENNSDNISTLIARAEADAEKRAAEEEREVAEKVAAAMAGEESEGSMVYGSNYSARKEEEEEEAEEEAEKAEEAEEEAEEAEEAAEAAEAAVVARVVTAGDVAARVVEARVGGRVVEEEVVRNVLTNAIKILRKNLEDNQKAIMHDYNIVDNLALEFELMKELTAEFIANFLIKAADSGGQLDQDLIHRSFESTDFNGLSEVQNLANKLIYEHKAHQDFKQRIHIKGGINTKKQQYKHNKISKKRKFKKKIISKKRKLKKIIPTKKRKSIKKKI